MAFTELLGMVFWSGKLYRTIEAGGTRQKARGGRGKGERASDKFYFAQLGVKVATLDGGVWGAERAVVPPINQFHAQHCVCPDFSC